MGNTSLRVNSLGTLGALIMGIVGIRPAFSIEAIVFMFIVILRVLFFGNNLMFCYPFKDKYLVN